MKSINHNILIFYAGIGGLFGTLCMVGFDKQSKLFYDFYEVNWGQVILIVCMGIFALWMSIISYQLVSPTVVAILKSQEIVIAFIIQCGFDQTFPYAVTVIGAIMVMLSAVIIPLEEAFLQKLPPKVARFF